MKRGWLRVWRATGAMGLGIAISTASVAQEKSVTPSGEALPSERDALAEAKREFENMKSLRHPPTSSTGDFPRGRVPEWQPILAAPTGARPPPSASRETKPKNWLVDAMDEQHKTGRSNARGDRERGDPDETRSRLREQTGSGKEAAAGRGAPEDPARTEASTAGAQANPLAGFLEQWMTPQDYALLKPGLANPPAHGGGRVPAAFDGASGSSTFEAAMGELRGDPRGGMRPGEKPGFVRPEPALNPYLPPVPAAESGLPIPSLKPHVVAVPATPAVPPESLTPPAPRVPASKIPEFARPATDEKYFRPLKRF